MTRSRGPRWLALSLASVILVGACESDDDQTSVASGGVGEGAGEDLDDPDDPSAPLICAEMTCPQDHVCINPPAYCDESGDEPVLRRDDAYCRPIASDGGAARDVLALLALAQPDCDPLAPALSQGDDGQAILTCPEIQLPCE